MPSITIRVRTVVVAVIVALVLGSFGAQSAQAASGRLIPPNEAFGIAAGLADAAGDLALQCLMGKIGDRIRGGTPMTKVASAAIKDSLAFAQAKKGCGATVETLKAAGVIIGLAELNQPAWVSLEQSTKRRPLRPDECTAIMRVGPSETLALKFTAKFTC
jgi:hypothetical protein